MNLSISEQIAYSTVRIECEYLDGSMGTGTGYFFKFKENKATNQFVPVVITNKHVIKDSKKGKILFTQANGDGEPNDVEHYDLVIDNFESCWIMHPETDVDLCSMPIASYINLAQKQGVELFYIPLDMSLIPEENQLASLSAVEDIIMVGYPNGIWDSVNNKPIFRKGITATHPKINYEGKKEFLIDAACFPGSSGSPVFILNDNGYRDGSSYNIGGTRVVLLGTLYAGPQHTASGEIEIIDVPILQKPITFSRIPNNLGFVIKSERIKELENMY